MKVIYNIYIYTVYELHINERNKKVIGIKRLIAFVGVNTLYFISSSKIFLSINTIHQDRNGSREIQQLNTDWIHSLFTPLMKHFNFAAGKRCGRPSLVTSSGILSSVWREGERTPLQGKLIFTEDAVQCCMRSDFLSLIKTRMPQCIGAVYPPSLLFSQPVDSRQTA